MTKALPPVPRGVSRDVQNFLTSVRETIQVQAGMGRGNSLDRAVTFRDLKAATGVTDFSSFVTKSSTANGGGVFNDPRPPKPANFKAFGMFNMVGLEWLRPTTPWYAFTEIYRVDLDAFDGETPVFADALFVGSSSSGFYSDMVEPDRSFIYWARHVNRDGDAGDVSSPEGTPASTSATPEDVLIKYSDEVATGDNFKWLRSDLSVIDSLNRSLQGSGLGDSALADLLSSSSSLSDILAEQAMGEALSKHTQSESIQQQFAKNYARLSGGIHAAVNADEAYVMRIQELESRWENDLGKTIDAKIESFNLALSSESGAIAQALTNYSVDYDGTAVSLQELASASAAQDGQYTAQWGVKSNVDGLQGGVGFLNNGTETSFVVDAGVFAVTGGQDELFPFVIKDGKTVIASAVIEDAEIYNLLSANIVAENIKVGRTLSSPTINGGLINGARLQVGTGFTVSEQGVMRAVDGFFEGELAAKKGYLENVRIAENCDIEGTLNAKNIDGDIVDRTVVVVDREITVKRYQSFVLISGKIRPGVLGATSERLLVVSGIALDHQGGGGSTSNFDVYLVLNGSVVQHFNSRNVNEEGSVTIQMGCRVPAATAEHEFVVVLKPGTNDNILVQQSAIVADVFKQGSTLTDVDGLYHREIYTQ